MTDVSRDVKRPYRSERRREQAEQTRARILDAAAQAFRERGYERASIAAIAEDAGVAEETVYAHFKNKRTLLGELVRRAVRRNDPRPLVEQDAPRAVVASRDQREQIRLFADDIADRLEHAAPLIAFATAAARAEPEVADLLGTLHANRFDNFRILVDALATNGPLRLKRDAATETVWALASPDLHQLLVRQRGWSRRRYTTWLVQSLEALLLPADA